MNIGLGWVFRRSVVRLWVVLGFCVVVRWKMVVRFLVCRVGGLCWVSVSVVLMVLVWVSVVSRVR